MSLTGTPFLILLGAITVAVPALTVFTWSRVRGPRAMRGVQRWAMVALCQLCAVALAGVAVNDYGLFIASWSEVGGGLAQVAGWGQSTTAAGAATVTRVEAKGRQPHFSAASQWTTRGRLDLVTISGATSGLSTDAYVYLPPQYFQPQYRQTDFPGVEVFAGYPGTIGSLAYRMDYPDALLKAISSRRAQPMVLVMLNPSVAFPRDTECTDVPEGPQVETFFGVDAPTAVAGHYRVQPTGWGAIGASTGGYCATKLAMRHPGRFTAAVSMSGHYSALRDESTGDLWGGSQAVRDVNDLTWRLAHLPAPPVSVLIGTSPAEAGQGGYREAMRFVAQVKAPMSATVLAVSNGGHSISTWKSELPEALPWLSAKLTPPGRATASSATGPGGTANSEPGGHR